MALSVFRASEKFGQSSTNKRGLRGSSLANTVEISHSWVKCITQEEPVTHGAPWILAQHRQGGWWLEKAKITPQSRLRKSGQSDERSQARALSLLGEQRCSQSSRAKETERKWRCTRHDVVPSAAPQNKTQGNTNEATAQRAREEVLSEIHLF